MNSITYFRLLLLDRGRYANRESSAPSPPPTYRSHNGTLVRSPAIITQPRENNLRSENNPPQYRTIDRHTQTQLDVSTPQRSTLSSNNPNTNVNTITTEVHEQPTSIDITLPLSSINDSADSKTHDQSLDSSPESSTNSTRYNELHSSNTDLVTIVTVSGCTDTEQLSNEMEILAHL